MQRAHVRTRILWEFAGLSLCVIGLSLSLAGDALRQTVPVRGPHCPGCIYHAGGYNTPGAVMKSVHPPMICGRYGWEVASAEVLKWLSSCSSSATRPAK